MSRRLFERGLKAALLFALSGCSSGLFQTAHTTPPGHLRGNVGLSYLSNRVTREQSRSGGEPFVSVSAQAGLRVGVTQHLDLGLGSFGIESATLDAKYNVLEHDQAWALAPRIGVAYGGKYETFRAEAGGIVSYKASRLVEPYLGLSFANYWITDYTRPDTPAPAGSRYARRTGSGDGVLQLNLGVELPSKHYATLLEYSHWFVLQDDPGDFYRFVPTNLVGVAVRF
ncbi:MAG TPA: hypothetical protein VNG33_03960 [Polyangiaceae bacterium]|nr:hypothetical protein [Polyangiaceae bacterium]